MQTGQETVHLHSTTVECLVSCIVSSQVGQDQDQMPNQLCCSLPLTTTEITVTSTKVVSLTRLIN